MLQTAPILVVGGGRWARVLLDVLCNSLSYTAPILVCSPRNQRGMMQWIAKRGLADRVSAVEAWPAAGPPIVIVANAVRDHEGAIETALAHGSAVLVEKPLTLSYASSMRVAEIAARGGQYLAAAHVLLFASYLEKFTSVLPSAGQFKRIRVTWHDQAAESRYGEQKRYDSSLPVIIDVLPHIIPVLLNLLGSVSRWTVHDVAIGRGGAQVLLKVNADSIPCEIELMRKGAARARVVEVDARKPYRLDFSVEPGWIAADDETYPGDEAWAERPSPLTLMLRAFLEGAGGGRRDPRLDVTKALEAFRVIDGAMPKYRQAQAAFVEAAMNGKGDGVREDLEYALMEIAPKDAMPPATVPMHSPGT